MWLIPSFFGNRRNNNNNNSLFDPFSSLDMWNPFDGFPFNTPSQSLSARDTSAFVGIDWRVTPEAHVFNADLPGVKKEDVKVEVEDGNVLRISGERKKEKNDTWHRVKRSEGRFSSMFRLPENARVDEVKAKMENGVLTVTVPVPKVEKKKPGVKSIQISG